MKKTDAAIPECLRGWGQAAANLGIQGPVKAMRTDAEHLKKVRKVPAGNEGHLQLQQRVLAKVHIDGVNLRWIIEEVIERVAPGARDHDDLAGGIEAEHLPIKPRIFPGAVINQVGAVDMPEDHVVGGFNERAGGVVDHPAKNFKRPSLRRLPWSTFVTVRG